MGEKETRSILQTCIQTGEQTPRTKSTEVKDGLHKQLPFCADRHALHQPRQTPCYSSTYIIYNFRRGCDVFYTDAATLIATWFV